MKESLIILHFKTGFSIDPHFSERTQESQELIII